MSARVRRPGAIQVHGVTVHSDVVWQIGNGPVRANTLEHVEFARGMFHRYQSGVAGMLCEGSPEYVNESDLGALHDALKAFNRGQGHALCLSCHRASAVLGLEVCSGCNDHAELCDEANPGRWCDVCKSNGWHHTDRHDEFTDEPRRIEPDAAFIDTDDLDPNTDQHGRVMRPGTAPFYGGL